MIVSKRTKQCRQCGAAFIPFQSTQKVCGVSCAAAIGRAKTAQDAARADRKDTAERKRKLKTLTDYLNEAQPEFNGWVRERDYGQPCISCQKPAKTPQAGHLKSVKARPDLRFHEMNVNLQCYACNVMLSGNVQEYRRNLEAIYDPELIAEELDVRKPFTGWTIELAIAIKRKYAALRKQSAAQRELNQEPA